MKKKLQLLKTLCEANGVPGQEIQVRKIMTNELKDIADKIEIDGLGSFIASKNSKSDFSPKVMIAGHMDEVGFMVKKIDDNGFITFQTLGGWWGHVLLGQAVTITTDEGKLVHGVIGSTPPHLLEGNAKNNVVKPDKMYIDLGVKSKKKVEKLGVQIGDMITPRVEFERMADKNYLKGKAFDNRIGCGVAIEVMKNLQDECPVNLYSVGTVQEEVGIRGAGTSANHIKPDVAFVVDVTLAGDTPGSIGADAKLGNGVVISLMDYYTISNKGLIKLVRETAKELNINIEYKIDTNGGTDAGKIHQSGSGVPTVGFAIPSRYIHSHNSMIHYQDYKDLITLITSLCKKIDMDTVKKLND